ncbi:MAG: 50S ribosomal protein L29 [Bacteroidales bacterium]|nr:50S ribosomal protein L29 [Bacteroidales bacterium]
MKNELVLKDIPTSELKEKLETERLTYQKMQLNHAISPLENPSKIKESRRNIARYLTELRARELAEAKATDAPKQEEK